MTNHGRRPLSRRSRGNRCSHRHALLRTDVENVLELSENTQHDCAHKGENNIRGDYAQLADEGTCDHSVVSPFGPDQVVTCSVPST
jgi:hypothetical protein